MIHKAQLTSSSAIPWPGSLPDSLFLSVSLSSLSSSLVGIADHALRHYHFLPQPPIQPIHFWFLFLLVTRTAHVPPAILPVSCLLLKGSDSDPVGACLCSRHLECCVWPGADFQRLLLTEILFPS